jgi:hypothetical protein
VRKRRRKKRKRKKRRKRRKRRARRISRSWVGKEREERIGGAEVLRFGKAVKGSEARQPCEGKNAQGGLVNE